MTKRRPLTAAAVTCIQVNVLRAAEEVGEIEKNRVREEAKAEVMAAKKELRTLSKRMEHQCTREVPTHRGCYYSPGKGGGGGGVHYVEGHYTKMCGKAS